MKLIKSADDVENWCQRHQYTKAELAEELNVTRQTLYNWLRDERGLPRTISLALHALEMEPILRQKIHISEKKKRKIYRRSTFEFDWPKN
jgi:DNA-binding XRE family transcriptional regulator